jgi:glycine/D-amino acid oxidase-like deaminating enzyme
MVIQHSYWWDNSSPDFCFQSQLPSRADVVIVGAGFAGISAAYWILRLANKKKKSLRVIVLEEAPHAAFKASGRMNGSVYLGSNKSANNIVKYLGEETAKNLYLYSSRNNVLLQKTIARGVECDPEFNGGFRMASTAREAVDLDDSTEILREWGYYPEIFDSNQLQNIMVVPSTRKSLFIPGEGLFDPFAFCNKMARFLRMSRAHIVYGARVAETDAPKGIGPRLLLENGHIIKADKIIHTTPLTTPWYRIPEYVVCRREQVVCTEPLSRDIDDMPLPLMPIEFNSGTESVRSHDQSIIMVGGKTGLRTDPERGETNDSGFNPRILQHLDKTMLLHLPITNLLKTNNAWTYIETETKDGLPLMGTIPGFKGHYINTAHGRNKFGLAFLGARNIAEKLFRVKVSSPEFKIFDLKRLAKEE